MSYAPHTVRSQPGRTSSTADGGASRPSTSSRPAAWSRVRTAGAAVAESRDWARVGMFGAGIAVGALLGAGAALLYAPQSGLEARTLLRGRARRATLRAANRWDELGAELRGAARRSKRRLRRGVAKSRWRAADSLDY
jgi:hypothetical protein